MTRHQVNQYFIKLKKVFKKILFGFIFLSCLTNVAQDFERVDAIITLYPKQFNTPEELSKFISRDFTTTEDKVRAIYTWIVSNIAYDPNEYKMFNYSFKNVRERNQKEEKSRNNLIIRVISKGIAVCEGYSMLFERLCELQDISSYLVRGDSKASLSDIGRKYDANHMWNIAYINEKPYLFDTTWGAGKFNARFIRDTTYYYFKTKPEYFSKNHYPELNEDSLLVLNIKKETFLNAPIVIHKKLLFEDVINPKTGILSSQTKSGNFNFSIKITPKPTISYSFGDDIFPILDDRYNEDISEFSIPVSLGAKYLIVYFDNKPALAYLIK